MRNSEVKIIEQLICIQTKVVTFKSLKSLTPQYLPNLFKKGACTSRNLRNTNTDVRLPKMNKTQGQIACSFRGAKIWNSLTIQKTHLDIENWELKLFFIFFLSSFVYCIVYY